MLQIKVKGIPGGINKQLSNQIFELESESNAEIKKLGSFKPQNQENNMMKLTPARNKIAKLTTFA